MAAEETSRSRNLRGITRLLWCAVLAALPLAGLVYILGIHVYFRLSVFEEQYVGLFLALLLFCTFIGTPARRGEPSDRVPWYDWLLAALGLATGLYITVWYPEIITRMGSVTPARVVFGTLAVLLILEGLRRTVGWTLIIVVAVFILYAFVAPNMPGPLHGSPTMATDLVNYLYLDANSMLRMVGIAATVALAFILYGQVLMSFGGADHLNNLAVATFGSMRGGPAKAAVVGSSLVGTVTGGPVTNVMLTGTVTIPLMMRTGYQPHVAGAVEAVASSGGQIMPPVMGVAAFLMADYLGVPYASVALAALVPAILYYICLFVQVDLMAAKEGMHGLSRSQIPRLLTILKTAWVIFPALGVLIYVIAVLRFDPSSAAVRATGLALPFLLLNRTIWKDFWSRFTQVVIETGRLMLEVGLVLAAAGLIVGVASVTGLGFNLAMTLTQLGGRSLILMLVLSAIVCLILGMGMPSVAAYAMVAVLVAPAFTELGVSPMAAHMFIFYFAILSNLTPPVAMACFAAAPIARASAMKIGYTSMRLGLVAYIVPFLFVYSPTLILEGTSIPIAVSVTTAIAGCSVLAMALIGYAFRPVSGGVRLLLAIGASALLVPVHDDSPVVLWLLNLAGALTVVTVLVREWWLRKLVSPLQIAGEVAIATQDSGTSK